jgi:membrane protease YdiL (CAAX protease family)
VKNKKVVLFLLFTFLWSWINWTIALHYLKTNPVQNGTNYFIRFFFLGAYGPTLSAIIMTITFDGVGTLRALMIRLFAWKASPKLYFTIFALPVLFMFLGIGLYYLFIGPVGNFSLSKISSIPFILGSMLLAGPLGEELGWRGYLLPMLRRNYSSTMSSFIIGVIWFCWHIPLFFAPFGTLVSNGQITPLNVSIYFVATICLSCIFTYLANITSGSIFIAILTHTSVNAGLALIFFSNLNTSQSHRLVFTFTMILLVLFTLFIGNKTAFRFEEDAKS